jgi:hypothetical protein
MEKKFKVGDVVRWINDLIPSDRYVIINISLEHTDIAIYEANLRRKSQPEIIAHYAFCKEEIELDEMESVIPNALLEWLTN